MDNHTLAERLKYARLTLRSLTLNELASLSGVAASTVQRYENGRINKAKIPVVCAFARALCVNPAWLMGDDAPILPPQPERDFAIVDGFMSVLDLADASFTDVDINGNIRLRYGDENLALTIADIENIVNECREFAKSSLLEHNYRRKKLRLSMHDATTTTL